MSKRSKMLLRLLLALVIVLSMGTVAIAAGAEQEPAPESTTEHTHNWVLQLVRTEYHAFRCTDCNETKQEAHTLDDAEICTVCGQYAHMHNWKRVEADEQFHTILCSGCQESKTATHSFDGQRCTVCGFEKHEHIWQYNGETYDHNHYLNCTKCDASGVEKHTYGEDGTCTVCGQLPPHEHQWQWNGAATGESSHILSCPCGETEVEKHNLVWDGHTRYEGWHGLVCTICGYTGDYGHMYFLSYVKGERCVYCGYETVQHTWQYNNCTDKDSHQMICTHCESTRFEAHSYSSKGKCKVCGYQNPDAPEQETKPTETKPAGTESTEGKPKETKPAETEAAVTEPTEEKPEETKPAETEATETAPTEEKPEETKPAGTEAAGTAPAETVPEDAVEEAPRGIGSLWVWAAAGVAVAGGLGAAVFFRKKKST